MGLENLLSGALDLPFLLTPFALLFWYAARGGRELQNAPANPERHGAAGGSQS
jgi:hypothetical protein